MDKMFRMLRAYNLVTTGRRCRASVFVCFVLCLLSGCAGNGQGLDENGNPIGTAGPGGLPVAFDPTFANIQQNVFSPICIECHIGPGAPQGLQLDDSRSYDSIVGIRSQERPEYFRVEPGNPEDSYLIRKLEGGPDIAGGQMPLNRPALPQTTINAIRIWIEQGAPRN